MSEAALEGDSGPRLRCSRCGWEFSLVSSDADVGFSLDDAPAPDITFEKQTSATEKSESGFAQRKVVDDGPLEAFELDDDYSGSESFTEDEGALDEIPTGAEVGFSASLRSDEKTAGDEDGLDELSLDLDDLNLDDIEFDSFDDAIDSAAVAGKSVPPAAGQPTRIDLDGDLNDLEYRDRDREQKVEKEAVVPAAAVTGENREPTGKRRVSPASRRVFFLALSCFVVMSLGLWAGYGLWQRFSIDMKKHLRLVEVDNQRLLLPSGRKLVILRGRVSNSSPRMVSDLQIKGILLDGNGQPLVSVITSGGVSFSEEELDLLDGSKLQMLESAEVTLAPAGELPFMIAFYDYPEEARDCYVEISSFKVKKGFRP
ncbi:MAG: DUF3426 domain-containing protein [Deltaproteobacteria bacterium]|nr:DUF3426 domain-containing protein [Deltaproteobacteria bacterium]